MSTFSDFRGSKRSALRAVSISLCWSAAKALARASPMPLLAPVIRHVLTALFSKIYYLKGLHSSKLNIIEDSDYSFYGVMVFSSFNNLINFNCPIRFINCY